MSRSHSLLNSSPFSAILHLAGQGYDTGIKIVVATKQT